MRAPPLQAVLKNFGYGIFLVELTPPPAEKVRPNGKKDVQQTEVFRSLRSSGMTFTEVVLDVEDESRAFAMASEGHMPTHFELSQISDGDWERIRTSVDMWGKQAFSDRLTMLEAHRTPTQREATP
jgi:hypothetical protein